MPNSTLTFAKRSLGLSKIQAGMGIFLGAFGVFVLDALSIAAGTAGSAVSSYLFTVAFMSFGLLMFSMPVLLLYVYDKNNGVLEYLLSVGWTQRRIFVQYLKSTLFLASTLFIAQVISVLIAGFIAGSQSVLVLDILMLLLTGVLGFSVVSFVTMAMMAFSLLQKQRVGSNSPFALLLGVVIILPMFLLPVIFGFKTGFLVDFSIAIFVGILSIVLLALSSRLIRREKMLP
ncbi:MAG TPA: hypothetical protein VMD05_02255 [Candidatus Nanoarchaeia archaeon]|nr:hypothetical protein [Candidatus Nanoarchaeia archaeon]